MRSRRSGLGRPLGDTKASGRRVTRKAPLAHVEGGSGRSEASPTAILKDTHSVEGYSVLTKSYVDPVGVQKRPETRTKPYKNGVFSLSTRSTNGR
jgi:hypothetical protein